MARTVVDMMDDEEWEDPIPAGVLPSEEPEPATEDAGFDALLKAPEPLPVAAPAASSQDKLDAVFNSGPSASERLKKAHQQDKRRAALDSASDALYAAFARRPIQKISNTPSEADAVSRAYGVERLDKQDARQARQDEQAADLNKARIAKLGQGKQPGQYKTLESVLGLASGSLDGADPSTVKEIAETIRTGDAAGARVKAQELALENQKKRDAFLAAEAEKRARILAGAKDDMANRGTDVYGLEKEPGASPTSDDAKRVKTTMDAANRLKPMVAALRKLHGKHGTEFSASQAGEEMQQIMTAIQIEAKTIAELGALSGPDLGLMKALAGSDPTSIENNVKAMFGVDNTQQALTRLEKWIDTAVEAKKQTYGYRNKTPAPSIDTSIPVREPGVAPGSTQDDEYEYKTVGGKLLRRKKVR